MALLLGAPGSFHGLKMNLVDRLEREVLRQVEKKKKLKRDNDLHR